MSKLLKIAGGFLATIMIAAGLTACGTPAGMNQAYLVTANVNNLTCSEANVEELQATADFAANVDDKQEQDIKKLNADGSDLTSLTTALDAKIAECSAATPEAAATETAAHDGCGSFGKRPVGISESAIREASVLLNRALKGNKRAGIEVEEAFTTGDFTLAAFAAHGTTVHRAA